MITSQFWPRMAIVMNAIAAVLAFVITKSLCQDDCNESTAAIMMYALTIFLIATCGALLYRHIRERQADES